MPVLRFGSVWKWAMLRNVSAHDPQNRTQPDRSNALEQGEYQHCITSISNYLDHYQNNAWKIPISEKMGIRDLNSGICFHCIWTVNNSSRRRKISFTLSGNGVSGPTLLTCEMFRNNVSWKSPGFMYRIEDDGRRFPLKTLRTYVQSYTASHPSRL